MPSARRASRRARISKWRALPRFPGSGTRIETDVSMSLLTNERNETWCSASDSDPLYVFATVDAALDAARSTRSRSLSNGTLTETSVTTSLSGR